MKEINLFNLRFSNLFTNVKRCKIYKTFLIKSVWDENKFVKNSSFSKKYVEAINV